MDLSLRTSLVRLGLFYAALAVFYAGCYAVDLLLLALARRVRPAKRATAKAQ